MDGNQVDQKLVDGIKQVIEKNVTSFYLNTNTELSEQRIRGYNYYYGESLGNEEEDRSNHISRDVFNIVEDDKASLVNSFSLNKQAVFFSPEPNRANDFLEAQMATAYCNYVFYKKNDGYKALLDSIHDGLVVKNGFIKRWWSKEEKLFTEAFKGLTEDQVQMALDEMDKAELKTIEEREIEVPNPEFIQFQQQLPMLQQQLSQLPPQQQQVAVERIQKAAPPQTIMQKVYDGEIEQIRDNSHTKIEVVPPEDIVIDLLATSLDDCRFFAHRQVVSTSRASAMGVNDGRSSFGSVTSLMRNQEKLARHSVDQTWNIFTNYGNRYQRLIEIFECYIRLDYDGDGLDEVYQVIYSNGTIYGIEQVDEIPFEYWSCFPLAHKFWGMSIPDVLWHIQKTKSSTQRQILDNMYLTNNPRWLVDLNFVRNPAELSENNLGALIQVDNMNAVKPFDTPILNPSSFSVLEMLDKDKEQITGNTRTAQGLNPDVIAKQNSFDMINAMVSNSNKRKVMMAKNYAEMLLKPLFKAIYKLGMKYDKETVYLMVDQKPMAINPSSFQERFNLETRVLLTQEEQDQQAQDLLMFHSVISQDQQMAMNYGVNQRYNLYQRAMELKGIDIRKNLLLDPASPEYAQAQQAAAEQAQIQQQKLDAQMQADMALKQANAQLMITQGNAEMFRAQQNALEDKKKIENQKIESDEKMGLNIRKQSHQEEIDKWQQIIEMRKLELEKMSIQKGTGT